MSTTNDVADCSLIEPTKVSEALKSHLWRATMEFEFSALRKMNTWTLVPPSPKYNIVGCKWIFCLKKNANGSIQRHKARLVAKGFHQTPGVDFFDTFSLVAKSSTIHIVLSIAVSNRWTLCQLDSNNAFLNGTLKEAIYMTQSLGFEDFHHPNNVWKLQRTIYDLKQALGHGMTSSRIF